MPSPGAASRQIDPAFNLELFPVTRSVIASAIASALLLLVSAGGLRAQAADHDHTDHARHHPAAHDTAFQSLQQRGQAYMGVDQEKSAHRFDDMPDGGRIELQSLTGDSADVATIRRHFGEIREQFSRGDFNTPRLVHAEAVPGTDSMRVYAGQLDYSVEQLPRGAALRIRSANPAAIAAVHRFLEFQRTDHRAPGTALPHH